MPVKPGVFAGRESDIPYVHAIVPEQTSGADVSGYRSGLRRHGLLLSPS